MLSEGVSSVFGAGLLVLCAGGGAVPSHMLLARAELVGSRIPCCPLQSRWLLLRATKSEGGGGAAAVGAAPC